MRSGHHPHCHDGGGDRSLGHFYPAHRRCGQYDGPYHRRIPAQPAAADPRTAGNVLRTVILQQLLPTIGGGQAPAFEIMHLNNAIRSMIRDSRIHQIDQVIQTSAAEGMISMDESILRLYKAGRITAETALRCAMIPEQLARRMGR